MIYLSEGTLSEGTPAEAPLRYSRDIQSNVVQGDDPTNLKATWVGLSLTPQGIRVLVEDGQ